MPPATYHFDSWFDFVSYVETKPKASWQRYTTSSEEDFSFYQTRNFSEALALAKAGWKEGAEKIKRLMDILESKLNSVLQKDEMYMDVFSPYGSYDMASVIAGVPENAINFQKVTNTDTQFKTVVVNLGASSGIHSDVMIGRGIVIAGLIQALERTGTQVKLVVVSAPNIGPNQSSEGMELYVTVKEHNQPLDLPLLAFILVHPSCLRRLTFKFREIIGQNDWSYGTSQDSAFKGDIYFKKVLFSEQGNDLAKYLNADTALAYILEQLKEYGVAVN